MKCPSSLRKSRIYSVVMGRCTLRKEDKERQAHEVSYLPSFHNVHIGIGETVRQIEFKSF